MLDVLSKGFKNAQMKLRGQSRLTPENLKPALREVRASLLQADVQLQVAKAFLQRVEDKLTGDIVQLRNKRKDGQDLTPSDWFIKACYDELVDLLGPEEPELSVDGDPAVLMMVGLQGSGKTTTTGKLAKRLIEQGKKPLLVAADIYRPAAIDQLMVLGRRLDVPVFSIKGMDPVSLAEQGIAQAKRVGRDVVILDTAGRLAIDNALMDELVQMKARVKPGEVLFVADAMIGQDAVATAAEFDRRLDFTGFVLTKMDGDARGGAALSIKAVTGKPVKLLGQGEDLDRLETFRPEGLAQRILGFGDVVGLVEDFERHADLDQVEKSAERMLQGQFTYDDFISQMKTIRRMGPLRELLARMPGISGMMDQIPPEALDDREMDRTLAIIHSMTRQERRDPDVMNSSRIERIAKGSGRSITDVSDLHNRFLQARQMMAQLGGMMGNPQQMAAMQQQMAQMGGMGGMPGMGGGFPGMPGLGGAPQPRVGGAKALAERRKLSAEEKKRKKAERKRRKKNRRK